MLGIASSTWNAAGIILGFAGFLLLFRFGMPGRVQTGGHPIYVANKTSEDEAEEQRHKKFGYLGLLLATIGAACALIGNYS